MTTARFGGLDFLVPPGCYAPVEWFEPIIDAAKPHLRPGTHVLDMGCGVGSIALALASLNPHIRVYGVDLHHDSVMAARLNAARFGLTERSQFLTADVAEPPWKFEFDLVTSVLPTDSESWWPSYQEGGSDANKEAYVGRLTGLEPLVDALIASRTRLTAEGRFIHLGESLSLMRMMRCFWLTGYEVIEVNLIDPTPWKGWCIIEGRLKPGAPSVEQLVKEFMDGS